MPLRNQAAKIENSSREEESTRGGRQEMKTPSVSQDVESQSDGCACGGTAGAAQWESGKVTNGSEQMTVGRGSCKSPI